MHHARLYKLCMCVHVYVHMAYIIHTHTLCVCLVSVCVCICKPYAHSYTLRINIMQHRRIIEVDHGSFAPFLFSTSCGWGPAVMVAFRRQHNSRTLGFLWCKIAFSCLTQRTCVYEESDHCSTAQLTTPPNSKISLWTSLQGRSGCPIDSILCEQILKKSVNSCSSIILS